MCHFHEDKKLYIFTKTNKREAFRPTSNGLWVRTCNNPFAIRVNQHIVGYYTIFRWMKKGEKKLENEGSEGDGDGGRHISDLSLRHLRL